MLGEHVVPQSEVIRPIVLDDSPCCAGVHQHRVLEDEPALRQCGLELGGGEVAGAVPIEELEGAAQAGRPAGDPLLDLGLDHFLRCRD